MCSGVRTALKSWLAFGASLTGNQHQPKSVASVRMSTAGSVSESASLAGPQSRMRVMFRHSTANEDPLKFDEEMGPDVSVPSFRSKRATKALAHLEGGKYEKNNRRAAEHVHRVGTFYN